MTSAQKYEYLLKHKNLYTQIYGERAYNDRISSLNRDSNYEAVINDNDILGSLSTSAKRLGYLQKNADKYIGAYGQKAYEQTGNTLFTNAQTELEPYYKIYDAIKDDYAVNAFKGLADIKYTNSIEDKIRQSAGLVPANFNVNSILGLPTNEYIKPDNLPDYLKALEKQNALSMSRDAYSIGNVSEKARNDINPYQQEQITQANIQDIQDIYSQAKAEVPAKYETEQITDANYAKYVDTAINLWQDQEYFNTLTSEQRLLYNNITAGLTNNTDKEISDALYYIGKGEWDKAQAVIDRTAKIERDIKQLSEQEAQAVKDEPYYIAEQVAAYNLENIADPNFDEVADSYTIQGYNKPLVDMTDEDWLNSLSAFVNTGRIGMYASVPYMTDEQKKVYAYYMSTDTAKAMEYRDAISRQTNAKRVEKQQQAYSEAADEPGGKLALAMGSIAGKTVSGISLIGAGIDALGGYEPSDPNALYNTFAQTPTLMRETSLRDLSDAEKYWANIGFSTADFAVAYLATGGAGGLGKYATTSLMASEAAGQQSYDVMQRGGSAGQAFLSGTLVGGVEAATELITLGAIDEAIAIARQSGKKSVMTFLRKAFKTAGAEGGEEILSEIGDNIVDMAVMGNRSSYELYVQSLVAQGVPEAEARQQAAYTFFGKNVALAFVGGAISGGLIGGGVQVANMVNTNTDVQAAQTLIQDIDNTLNEDITEGTKKYLTNLKEQVQEGLNNTSVEPQQADTGVLPTTQANPLPDAGNALETTTDAITPQNTTDFTFDEMANVEQDIVYDLTTEADVAREQIGDVTQELNNLQKVGRVTIPQNSTLTEAMDILTQKSTELQNNIEAVKGLEIPSVTVNNLLPSEIRNIGEAIRDKTNTVTKLKKAVSEINKRVRKIRSGLENKTVTKIKNFSTLTKTTPEFRDFIDSVTSQFDTKSRSMTEGKRLQLESIREYFDTNEIEMPQWVQDTVSRLEKMQISDLSNEELETLYDTLNYARIKDLEARQQEVMLNKKTQQENVKTILNDAKKIDTTRKAWKYKLQTEDPALVGLRVGEAFQKLVIRPIQLGSLEHGFNQRYIEQQVFQPIKDMAKRLGKEKSGNNVEVFDNILKMKLSETELVSLYLNAKDTQLFEELVEGTIYRTDFDDSTFEVDRQTLREFVNKFEQSYPDFMPVAEAWSKARDYFKPKLNDTVYHTQQRPFITQQMTEQNPDYYRGIKEDYKLTDPTYDIMNGNINVPGFVNQRTGGGKIRLVNPIWVINNYVAQSNRYVSFAKQVYDSNKLVQNNDIKRYLRKMGKTKKGQYIFENYFNSYLNEVMKGSPLSELDTGWAGARGRFAQAKLFANFVVPAVQFASYPVAFVHIDMKHLFNVNNFDDAIGAITNPKAMEYVYNVAPDLYERFNKGQSLIELGELINKKVINGRMIRTVDEFTVLSLFFAAQNQISAQNPSLDINSEQFKSKLSNLFHEALWDSQPMYDKAFRTPLQRSEIGKTLGMFTTQIFQQHNLIKKSMQYWQQGNKSKATKGVLGVLAGIALYAAIRTGVRRLWGKDDKFWENLLGAGVSTVNPFAGKVTGELWNIVAQFTGWDKLPSYGVGVPVIDQIDEFFSAAANITSDKKTLYGKLFDLLAPAAEFFGIPAKNMETYGTQMLKWTFKDFDYEDLTDVKSNTETIRDYAQNGGEFTGELGEKDTLNDVFYEIASGEIEGDLNNLRKLYDKYDNTYDEKVDSLIGSIKNDIKNMLKEDLGREPKQSEIDEIFDRMGYEQKVLDFFDKPLDTTDPTQAELFDMYETTKDSTYLLDDETFTYRDKEYPYPDGWQQDVLDELEKTLDAPIFDTLTEEQQQKEIKNDINDYLRDLREDVLKDYPEGYIQTKTDVTAYDISQVEGWSNTNKDILDVLDNLDITPKNPQTLNGIDVTAEQKQELADFTKSVLEDLDSYTNYTVTTAIDTAYNMWAAYQIPGWDDYALDDSVISAMIDVGVKPRNAATLDGQDLTESQKTQLANLTYQMISDYITKNGSITADKAEELKTKAYYEWKNGQ